jgi:hypothetical protein
MFYCRRSRWLSTFRIDLPPSSRGSGLSLVIFNSTAVPVFPLTDDYDFVEEQFVRRPAGLRGELRPRVLRRDTQRAGEFAHR